MPQEYSTEENTLHYKLQINTSNIKYIRHDIFKHILHLTLSNFLFFPKSNNKLI